MIRVYQFCHGNGNYTHYAPLFDEPISAIWIPRSMMCVVAVLIIIHMWGQHGMKPDLKRAAWSSNSAALLYSTIPAALIEQQRTKTRAVALGLVTFVVTVFSGALFVGVLSDLSGNGNAEIEANDGQVRHTSHRDTRSKQVDTGMLVLRDQS